MKIIDISWPLNEATTAYKDKKIISLTPTKQFEQHSVRETAITIGSHSGTHIDAPSHFLKNGETIDEIALEALCGPCTVVDMTHVSECIRVEDVKKITIPKNARILFKTSKSKLLPDASFNAAFIYLHADAAAYLAQQNIAAIGIDYLGIGPHETHIFLLEKNIPIIEGLRLKHVAAGQYQLFCLPLALQGCDAAPARAILIAT